MAAKTPDAQGGLFHLNLDAEGLRIIGYAAAMGREFEFNVLRESLEIDDELLAETLEGMVHKGIFRELRGGDVYVFTKEETINQTIRALSSSRLRIVHRKIGEAYEKVYPSPPAEFIPELGRHFYLGKVHEKSLRYNRFSATLAENNLSPDAAIQYLERVRADLSELEGDHRAEQADTLRELGDLYVAVGDSVKADELYAKCLELIPPEEGTLRAITLLARAEAARGNDSLILAKQYCNQAIEHFEKVSHRKGLASAHRILSRIAYKEGELSVGKKEIEKTLGLLDPVADAREIGRCYIDLGNTYSSSTSAVEDKMTVGFFHKAISILEPLKDWGEVSRAHNNLAVQLSAYDPEGAVAELELARQYAEKARDKRAVAWALFNSVEFHLKLGRVKQAEDANNAALAILTKVDDKVGLQQVKLNQGILAQSRKQYAEAERFFRDSLARAVKLGYPQDITEMHLRLAMLFLESGDLARSKDEMTLVETVGVNKLAVNVLPVYEKTKARLATELSKAAQEHGNTT